MEPYSELEMTAKARTTNIHDPNRELGFVAFVAFHIATTGCTRDEARAQWHKTPILTRSHWQRVALAVRMHESKH